MAIITMHCAMNIRAYGTVSVEADSEKEAIEKITVKDVVETFELAGCGDDDHSYGAPTGIYLSDPYDPESEDDPTFFERDVEDDIYISDRVEIGKNDILALVDDLKGRPVSDETAEILARFERIIAAYTAAKMARDT